MATRPLVSVLTPTYNGESFVGETIESVLAQTYPHVEHVLIDDGSTDATPEILRTYAGRHPHRIRAVAHRDRAGPCRRRNEAIETSSGEVLAWLDHDDVWLPEKLERQIDALARRAEVGFVATQWELFDHATGKVLQRSAIETGGDPLRRLLIEGVFIASSTVVFRRSALATRSLRLRERDFSWGDDHYLWLSLALDWKLEILDDVLVRRRMHGSNESVRLAGENPYPRSIELIEEFLDEYPDAAKRVPSAHRLATAHHMALGAIYELDRGRRGRAAAYALRAAAGDPAGAYRYARRRVRRAVSR